MIEVSVICLRQMEHKGEGKEIEKMGNYFLQFAVIATPILPSLILIMYRYK